LSEMLELSRTLKSLTAVPRGGIRTVQGFSERRRVDFDWR